MGDGETLAEAIDRIGHLRPESRGEKAEAGYRAVQSLNEGTMAEWIDVLNEVRGRT